MAEEDLNIRIGGDASGMEQASQKGSKAANKLADGAVNLQKAFRTVKQTIDPTYSALERYNKAQAANADLLKAGAVSASEWANTQVRLREAYDASVAAILRRTDAAKAEAAEQRRLTAQQKAQEREEAAEAKRAAREAAEAKKQAAKEAAAVAREEARRVREEERAAAAEAKRLAREEAAAKRQAAKEAEEAVKQAAREKREAERAAAAAAKQAARDEANAKRVAARAAREAAQQAREQAKAERMAANAATELRASIDPAFAAQQRYNHVMQQATQLLMQNKLKTGEWVAIQRQAKAQMDINTRSMGRMNTIGVQLGYQMQDVTASIASGINPLVILAQQGGQTASAMAMMGGKAGSVAAFFAGPWGAAIIGATLLLGYLWQSLDEGTEKTVKLTDAESLRTGKLADLIKTIREYTDAQREANNTTARGIELEQQGAVVSKERLKEELDNTQKKLDTARILQRIIGSMPKIPEFEIAQSGALVAASSRVTYLEAQVKKLKSAIDGTGDALTEAELKMMKHRSEQTALDQKYERVQQNIFDGFRREVQGITDATKRQEIYNKWQKLLTKASDDYKRMKKEETQALRENAQAQQAAFNMPVNGPITSGFGSRHAPLKPDGTYGSTNHKGIDIGVPVGTSVKAPQVGVIKSVGYSPEAGKYVVIDHGAGTTTRYLHLSETLKGVGEHVDQGEVFAKSGNTGGVRAHLHYEVLVNGKPVDPRKGIFGVDTLAAEERGMKALGSETNRVQKEKEDALKAELEGLDEKQAAARYDLNAQLEIEKEKEQKIIAFYGKDSKEAHEAAQRRIRLEEKVSDEVLEIRRNEIEQKAKLAEIEAQRDYQNAQTRLSQKSDAVDFNESNSLISPKQALAQKAAILQEEYQLEVQHEQRMYELKVKAMRDQLALEDLPPREKMRINDELEQAEAEHLSRVSTMYQENAREVRRMQLQTYQLTLNKFNDMLTTISQSFTQALQGMWMRSLSWKQAMINIGDAIAFKFMDMGVKMLTDWIRQQAIKTGIIRTAEATQTAVHSAGEATRTAATVAGSSTRAAAENQGFFSKIISSILGLVGIHVGGEATKTTATVTGATSRIIANKTEGLAALGTAVALAGANGVASWALAPWPIDMGAPGFGAAMASAAAGFGAAMSAAGGLGEVPIDDQLTFLHRKEMVLPAKFANPLREMLIARSSGGINGAARTNAGKGLSGGGHANFYYQPQTTLKNMSMSELLRRDGRELRRWLQNEHRNGNLRFDRP